ncbi:MAG TPA: cupin domain-containing protein [Bordetella sp.]
MSVLCRVEQSGMGKAPFGIEGERLAARMERIRGTFDEAPGAEEMIAVLDGEARLVCDDEDYALRAGLGLLVPAGMPLHWEVPGEAVVYRVKVK